MTGVLVMRMSILVMDISPMRENLSSAAPRLSSNFFVEGVYSWRHLGERGDPVG